MKMQMKSAVSPSQVRSMEVDGPRRLEALVSDLRGARSLEAIGEGLRAISSALPKKGGASLRERMDQAGSWLGSVFAAAKTALKSQPAGLRSVLADLDPAEVKLFCGSSSLSQVQPLAKALGLPVGVHDFRIFSTGDPFAYLGIPPNKAKGIQAQPEDVRGRVVYVVQGARGDSNYDLPTLVAESLELAYAAVENGAKKAVLFLPESLNPATHASDPFALLVHRLAVATGVAKADIRYVAELDQARADGVAQQGVRAGLPALGPKTEEVGAALDALAHAKDLRDVQKAVSKLDLSITGLTGKYPEVAHSLAKKVADVLASRLSEWVPDFGANGVLSTGTKTVVLAGQSNPVVSEALAKQLGASYGQGHLTYDGEGHPRVDFGVSVADKDVVIVQTTRQDPATAPEARHSAMGLLMEALLLYQSAVARGAKNGRFVLLYEASARSDKADQKGVGCYAAMVARWVTAIADDAQGQLDARARRSGRPEGVRPRVVLVEPHDPHNPHYFGIPVDVISGAGVLARHVIADVGRENLVIQSPDQGAVKRTKATAEAVGLTLVKGSKSRDDNEEKAKVEELKNKSDIDGKKVLLIDDEIATGGTMCQTVAMDKAIGAEEIYVAVSHCNMPLDPAARWDAMRKLREAGTTRLYLLDTQPVGDLPPDLVDFVHVVSVAETIAKEAI